MGVQFRKKANKAIQQSSLGDAHVLKIFKSCLIVLVFVSFCRSWDFLPRPKNHFSNFSLQGRENCVDTFREPVRKCLAIYVAEGKMVIRGHGDIARGADSGVSFRVLLGESTCGSPVRCTKSGIQVAS